MSSLETKLRPQASGETKMVAIDVTINKACKNTSSEQHLWDACTGPIYRIVDEEGNNGADAQIRHLTGKYWLAVDDMDGYQILPESDVEGLSLVAA
jgi:hypothetical protein